MPSLNLICIFALVASLFLGLASVAQAASSTGIIIPLYIYPEAGSWDPLVAAIRKYPQVPYTVVVNPNSGPGSPNSQPDSNYRKATAQLKAFPNVRVIGYVSTYYGQRNSNDVLADVTTYKGWPQDARPNGIFFDETPDQAGNGLFEKYKAYTAHARKLMANSATIVYNPGTTTDEKYFSLATQVVTYEQSFSRYKYSSLMSRKKEQASIIIHSFPKGDTAKLKTTLQPLANKVKSVYITDLDILKEDVYKGFGSLLNATAAYLNSV